MDAAHISHLDRLPARFWAKVDKTGECWLWLGTRTTKGYGQIQMRYAGIKQARLAHRVSYFLAFGDYPDDAFVCHRCDVTSCVRPEHLFLASAVENTADMLAKGRDRPNRARGERASKAKLTADKVREIRALRASGHTYAAIGRAFGITQGSARAVAVREHWKHIP